MKGNVTTNASVHYLQTLENFDDLVEDFKLKLICDTDSINNNNYGEN